MASSTGTAIGAPNRSSGGRPSGFLPAAMPMRMRWKAGGWRLLLMESLWTGERDSDRDSPVGRGEKLS